LVAFVRLTWSRFQDRLRLSPQKSAGSPRSRASSSRSASASRSLSNRSAYRRADSAGRGLAQRCLSPLATQLPRLHQVVRESPAKAAHMTQVITAVPGLAPKSRGCPNGTEGQSWGSRCEEVAAGAGRSISGIRFTADLPYLRAYGACPMAPCVH